MQKGTGKTIRATRIEVVDQAGRVRAVLGRLGESEHGVYGVAVCDENGRERAWLLHDGPAAEVGIDFDGNTVAALTVAADGRAELVLPE